MNKQTQKERPLFSLADACDELHITRKTGLAWIKIGRLKALRPGHAYLIPKAEIDRLLSPVEAKDRGRAPDR